MVAASCEDWPTFVSKGLAGRIVAGEDTYYRKSLGSAVLDAYQPFIHHARAVLLEQIVEQNEATRRVLDRFGQAYQRLKLRHRALRFEDITHVLAHTLTSASLDHLRYRLDTPIAHLLLDEFQDTSLTQWSAIRPFAERVTAQVGHSFFCVGDVKQAIYGWRGGVAELVDTVVGQYEHGMPDWQQKHTWPTHTDLPEMPANGSGEPEVLAIQLRAPLARRTRGLERVSPSQAVERPGVRLADRMRPGASQTMARGALLHAWLEHIEWLDDGEPEEGMLRRVAHNFATVELGIEAEIQAFRSMLAFPQTRTVLSCRGYGDLVQLGFSDTGCADVQHQNVALRVLRERPFVVRENDAVVYGIIDRLVLFCRGDKVLAADLLDVKSDAFSVRDAAEIDEAVVRYQPQLTMYHRAITQQFALDVDRIATRLLFVQIGEVRRVEVL